MREREEGGVTLHCLVGSLTLSANVIPRLRSVWKLEPLSLPDVMLSPPPPCGLMGRDVQGSVLAVKQTQVWEMEMKVIQCECVTALAVCLTLSGVKKKKKIHTCERLPEVNMTLSVWKALMMSQCCYKKKQWIKCVRERGAKHSQQTLINNLSDAQKAVAAVLGSTSLHAGLLEMMLKLCNRYPRILLLATTNWSKFISITPLTQLIFNLGG